MGAIGDFSRINSNYEARRALSALQDTNATLGTRQMRLATGNRINAAEDDSAGYAISKKLEARVRGQAQALANIGDAKSLLTVAEGGLNTIMDILQTMKEKTVQAANDTMGTQERASIQTHLNSLASEVTDILGDTSFNGNALFGATSGVTLTFQVNADNSDTFEVVMPSMSITNLGIGSLNVTSAASTRSASIAAVDAAIVNVANRLATIGDDQKRLSIKQENLTTSMNNYESARSRIADADFAKEQMEIVKLQILQQTGTAALSQANQAPQAVLSLIGG